MASINWLHDADGDFADGTGWSGGVVPGPGDFAHITASGAVAYTVTSSAAETVETLHMAATASLDITGGAFAATDGTGLSGTDPGDNAGLITIEAGAGFTAGGTLTNDGFIDLASTSTSNRSRLSVAASGLVLAGTGTLSLANGGIIQGAAAGATLTNYGLIEGGGEIEFNLALINKPGGVIEASNSSQVMGISIPTLVNEGLIDSEGNELVLGGTTVTGAGGTIHVGASHFLALETSEIDGGALQMDKGSFLAALYGDNTLSFGAADSVSVGGVIYAVNGPMLTITGGTVRVAGGVFNAGGGSVIDFEGVRVTDAGGASDLQTQDSAGVIRIGDGSSFEIGGFIFNVGTIALAGVALNADLKVVAGGAILGGGGTVTMSGAKARILGATASATLDNENTIVGMGSIGAADMTLVNDSVIEATGLLTVRDAAGATLTNSGLMEAAAAGTLALVAETIDQSGGGVILAAGGLVTLQGVDFIGGSLTTTGAGRINVDGGGATLDGSVSTVTNSGLIQVTGGQTLTVAGAIANSGKVNLQSARVVIAAAGATLSGKGQVNLNSNSTNVIVGAAANATLINLDNRIAGSGQLGGGTMALVNHAAGVIVGNLGLALTINTGAHSIANAGLIENIGKGGVVIDSVVNNTGTLRAATAGTLTLAGAVTGAGIGQIAGGTLYAKAAFTENVTFTGTTGVLKLGDSVDYTGQVAGLSKTGTNSLDLADIAFSNTKTKASYSGTTASGTLTVTDGTHTAHITLIGNYVGSTFTLSTDGHTGTTVVDPAPLAQAMAGFQHGPPPHLAATPAYRLPRFPMFHAQA